MTVHRLSSNDQCAICGGWRIGWTGYVFFDDGATHTGIPFCKTHADQLQQFSNPAFESDVALSLCIPASTGATLKANKLYSSNGKSENDGFSLCPMRNPLQQRGPKMKPESDEEAGLAKIDDAYFMIRTPSSGITHAINPKTKRPYCGWKIKWRNWEPTDRLPDDEHQPSCKICQCHYDGPIREELYRIKAELEESISDFLFMQVHTKNADGGLGRFVENIAQFMRSENVKAKIRQKLEKKFPI